jgi:hypothetical protein
MVAWYCPLALARDAVTSHMPLLLLDNGDAMASVMLTLGYEAVLWSFQAAARNVNPVATETGGELPKGLKELAGTRLINGEPLYLVLFGGEGWPVAWNLSTAVHVPLFSLHDRYT